MAASQKSETLVNRKINNAQSNRGVEFFLVWFDYIVLSRSPDMPVIFIVTLELCIFLG